MNSWLNISVLSAIFSFFWTAYKYFDLRNREQDRIEFENYHRLIKELVQPEKEVLYVDRQGAIIYELRFFKRYYPHSLRMLIGLREKWKGEGDFPRLIEELNSTIDYLQSDKDMNFFERLVSIKKRRRGNF